MGSPPSEAGRFEREVPQHEVTLTAGRWLADEPCTQALWEAVMGNNPSYFVSPDRPVEQVSWDDCQEFVQKLNKRVPGLESRLPSETEWEHACRAGTPTATWLGDLEILGENHAPLLDEIAWYGGNSGQEYELENGFDSSDWPNKQYPHTKAGTHPVRTKAASPLGLFDMLGNVYEWCMDWYGPYGKDAVTNPPLPSMGSNRVYRGGSWFNFAQFGRAAIRLWSSPVDRDDSLGFRLARGQGSSQTPGGTGTASEEPPRPARSADREVSKRKR
jgi:formylglycine-generating enzyme required for sulfatase activity